MSDTIRLMSFPSFAKKTLLLLVFGYLIIFIFSFLVSFFYFAGRKVYGPPVASPIPTACETPAISSKTINILLLGHGGEGHPGGNLMDSIILASINLEEKKVVLISIPRDLYLFLPTDYENLTAKKINEAYAIGINNVHYPNKKPEFRGESGGWELMKYAVTKVTGIPINYFIAVDFSAFQKAIDVLGGVEVDIPNVYDDYYYPLKGKENETCGFSNQKITELHQKYSGFELEKQFTCRYEHIHFEKGKMMMDGATALKYTRSRHGDGDFGRSQRQFAVLAAIKDKAASLEIVKKGGALLNQLIKTVKTDLELTQIESLLDSLGSTDQYKIISVHLTEDNFLRSSAGAKGAFILVPKAGFDNFSEIKNFITGVAKGGD